MALLLTSILEINSAATAGNVNGAFFDTAAPTATDLTTDANTANTASPVVSSASYNFVAGDVNAWLYIGAGTNWLVGWYRIASVASNKATLSAAIGAAIQTSLTKGYPTPQYAPSTVIGCATVGTPTSGTWSIDYSQGTAAIATAADLVIDGAVNTKVTSVTRAFGVNDVGNHLHITAGASFTVGWYRIVSVSAGAATLDRSPGATGLTGGTWYEGGAASLNSATAGQTDDSLFKATVAGMRVFLKGSLALAAAVAGTNGTSTSPIVLEGYATLRGDAPTGASRPTVNYGAFGFNLGTNHILFHLISTGTEASGTVAGARGTAVNCKFLNTSATAARAAVGIESLINCEIICYRGYGRRTGGNTLIQYCYVHDCDIGLDTINASSVVVIGSIFESCVTGAIVDESGSTSALIYILCNTLYGAENKLGLGIDIRSTSSMWVIQNNIVYGFTTGINNRGTIGTTTNIWDAGNNDIFNCTTPSAGYGALNDQAVDPAFVSVSQITGTAGKFRAGNDAIIDTTKNFTTLGVVAGRDCIYIKSGTGATAGIYGVSSIATTTNPNDTLVLDLSPGTSTVADKAYQLTVKAGTTAQHAINSFFPKKVLNGFPSFTQMGALQPPRLMQHAIMQGGPN